MTRKCQTRLRLSAMGVLPIAGFAAFYLLPLCMTFWYTTVKSSFQADNVGLGNFAEVWGNRYFQLGLTNLLILGLVCFAGAALLALLLAWLMSEHPKTASAGVVVLILPLLIPSVSAVSLWNWLFQVDILTPWPISMAALASLYWWKCAGPAAVLMYIALRGIPQEVMDAAALDGCNKGQLFFRIRLPMIRSQIMLSALFLLMYYFRIYKESYLLFGQYPGNALYLLQHYMNNHYLKMNVQYVSVAAATLVGICLLAFGGVALLRERRFRT